VGKRRLGLFTLCGLGLTVMTGSADAQIFGHKKEPCPPTIVIAPAEQATTAPQTTTQAPTTQTPPTTAQAPQPEAPPAAPNVDLGGGLALGETTVAMAVPGYIDNAMPMNRIRLRYDFLSNDPFPDRGEFFYPKCGCFRDPAAGTFFDPRAKGPARPETGVDAQEVEFMAEKTIGCRASVFIEAPFRFINPEQNDNENGFSDLKIGFKYALIASPDMYLTAQLRIGFPTGDGRKGLGNELTSYEPALLLTRKIGCRSYLHGEFRGWIPTNGSDFAADILRYGVGYSYLAVERDNFTVLPVVEVVGWTLLDGKMSSARDPAPIDAGGDTIVNGKIGVRFGFGDRVCLGQNRSQLYVGYGHALTGDKWYEDIYRVEYQISW